MRERERERERVDQLKSKYKSNKIALERCGNEIYDFSICICQHKVTSLSPNTTTKKKSGLTHIRTIVILKKMDFTSHFNNNSNNNNK